MRESIPEYIKEVDTIDRFRVNIKNCKPVSALYRLCKVYLQQIGYM